jgi:hypothetical protein
MNEAAGLFSAHPESLPREVVHTRKGKEEMTDTGVYGEIFVGDQNDPSGSISLRFSVK